MHAIYFRVSAAAIAAAIALSLTGHDAIAAGTDQAAATLAAPLPSQRVPGNGGVRPALPAASAASRARGDTEVQTTTSDGRKETRGAPERRETDDAKTPND